MPSTNPPTLLLTHSPLYNGKGCLTSFPLCAILYFVHVISQEMVERMKLSTRGQDGTRALLDLALHQGEEPILLKDIARRQQISLRYLEQLMSPLITGGIVRSTRGPKGGVSLARTPEEITLSEVIRFLEGSVAPVECVSNPGTCPRSTICLVPDT